MKISVSDEKKRVEDQRRILEENIQDFQRRKAQFAQDKMNAGHHTLTLGKLGKKK
jgi:septin 6/8/11